jgi:hypothetical protein
MWTTTGWKECAIALSQLSHSFHTKVILFKEISMSQTLEAFEVRVMTRLMAP